MDKVERNTLNVVDESSKIINFRVKVEGMVKGEQQKVKVVDLVKRSKMGPRLRNGWHELNSII